MCLHTYNFTIDQSNDVLKDVELIKFASLDGFIPKMYTLLLNQSASLPRRNHEKKFYEKKSTSMKQTI